jgi:short-subunit dehydrogenase
MALGWGFYSATKSAMETIVNSLRMEMSIFNVSV